MPEAHDGFPDDIKQYAPSAEPRSPPHDGYGWPSWHTQSLGSGDAKHASPPAGLPPQAAAVVTPLRHQLSTLACAPAGNGVPHIEAAVAMLCANPAHWFASSCCAVASGWVSSPLLLEPHAAKIEIKTIRFMPRDAGGADPSRRVSQLQQI